MLSVQTSCELTVGLTLNDRPVHASSARLWATIQSTDPSSWRTEKDVTGLRTDINAFTGLVADI